MGKIIKFDPRRRSAKRSWTRPEDYGVASTPKPPRKPEPRPEPAASGWPDESDAPPRTRLLARVAVAGIIGLGVLTSLYGLT